MQDLWTSSASESYLGVMSTYLYIPMSLINVDTVYYNAYDLSIKTRLLSLAPLQDRTSHNSDSLKNSLEYLMSTVYNVNSSTLLGIVSDNAPVNPETARKMGTNFFGCISHKINLIVKDIVEEVDEIATMKSVAINPTIAYFRRSDIASTTADLSCSLQMYCATRWYSFHGSVESLLKNKDKIVLYFASNRTAAVQSHNKLDELDFDLLNSLLPILAVFSEMIGECSISNCSIGFAVPMYLNYQTKLEMLLAMIQDVDHKQILTQILESYNSRLEYLIADNFTAGAYLLAGKRDETYYIYKNNMGTARFDNVLDFYFKMICDLKRMRIGTLDTTNRNEIKNQFTGFINMPQEFYKMLVDDVDGINWKNVAKSFPHVANVGIFF